MTYSRGTPAWMSADVGSSSRSSVAGSAVRVSVTTADFPAARVIDAGVAVMVAPPAVEELDTEVVYRWLVVPKFFTVTVFLRTTGASPTGTIPQVTEVSSGFCVLYAMTLVETASNASTRPEPTRSGP